MKKLAIGITGGIGSGKSTVAQIYEDEGFIVLKADIIAKELMLKDPIIITKIKKEFGEESYLDGKINSKFLAKKVFNEPHKLQRLNSIVHPAVIKSVSNQIKEYQIIHNLIFVESALIYEAKMEDLFDYILMVSADEEIRISRVHQRDGETIEEIKNRINNQLPEKDKIARSHFTINNSGSLEELKSKSLFFLNLFQKL